MRYELNQSVRLVYAERTGTVIGLQPPANYVVHTEDGHTWTVGEDELAPLKPAVGNGAPSVFPPASPSDGGPYATVAVRAEPSVAWGYERPAAAHYRPSSSKGNRGAGWALGFMPLAMLAAQYAITIVLAKQLGAAQLHTGSTPSPFLGIASGGGLALLGLAFTVIGPLIVYSGTQDAGLTVGYFVVRWIEGYLFSFVLTGAVLASLGLHVGPSPAGAPAPAPVPGTPVPGALTRSGKVATPRRASSRSVSVPNAQGIYLNLTRRTLTLALPGELKVGGLLVSVERSTVYLHCIPVRGSGFSLSPQEVPTGAQVPTWHVGGEQRDLRTCYGTVTLAHGGIPPVNKDTSMYGFNLLPWALDQH
jgi:hypothetical protein